MHAHARPCIARNEPATAAYIHSLLGILALLHPRLLQVNLVLVVVLVLVLFLVVRVDLLPALLAQEVLDRLGEDVVRDVDAELQS